MSFISDVIIGVASIIDIDDYIDDWHSLESLEIGTLYEFLGMNEQEYESFLEDESNLYWIVEKYRYV